MEPAKYEGRDIEPAKKLYRRRSDRMLTGVCGGLADYFSVSRRWPPRFSWPGRPGEFSS
jgi:hypothetical protein